VRDDASRGHGTPQRERSPLNVEEDQIERKTHADGVNAPAARDQQARAGGLAVKQRKAEEAGTEAGRDRDLMTEEAAARERAQARGQGIHASQMPTGHGLSPTLAG
jgi:hypothetical protein